MSNPVSPSTRAPVTDAAGLFAQLVGMLGAAAIGRMFPDSDINAVRALWEEHLAGFSRPEIERGLREVATRRFPPTLGEFATFCRPALDPEVAWYEAEAGLVARDRGEHGEWTHPAVWRAACTLSTQVRTGEFTRHRGRWTAELKRELARGVADGIPKVPMRVEHQARTGPPPKEVRERIRGLLASMPAGATNPFPEGLK